MKLQEKDYQITASYKFILCILVIFLHNKTLDYFQLTVEQLKVYNFFIYYIPQLAVPSFMILSGYMMFYGFEPETAKGKINRRLSKLIPAYLFWNVVAIPYAVAVSGYRHSFSSIQDVIDVGADILTNKFNFPLWYIFDLVIFVAISYILYFLLKNKWIGAGIILLVFILYAINVRLPNIMYRNDVHLYYLLGAYAGLHCPIERIAKIRYPIMFVTGIVGLVLSMWCEHSWIKAIGLSIYAIGMIVGYCNAAKGKVFSQKMRNIFVSNTFIYYTHFFFIGGIKKVIGIIFRKISLSGFLWCVVAFCLSTITCVVMVLCLRKISHSLINRIKDGRIKRMALILVP